MAVHSEDHVSTSIAYSAQGWDRVLTSLFTRLLPDNQSGNTHVSGTTFRGVNASIMGDGSTVWEFASIHCRPGQSPIPLE